MTASNEPKPPRAIEEDGGAPRHALPAEPRIKRPGRLVVLLILGIAFGVLIWFIVSEPHGSGPETSASPSASAPASQQVAVPKDALGLGTPKVAGDLVMAVTSAKVEDNSVVVEVLVKNSGKKALDLSGMDLSLETLDGKSVSLDPDATAKLGDDAFRPSRLVPGQNLVGLLAFPSGSYRLTVGMVLKASHPLLGGRVDFALWN